MKFQRFSFSLLLQLKSGTKRDTLYMVRVRGCRRNLSDRAQHKETKGFWTSTTREHLLAFVYKRSFSNGI